MIFKRKSCIFFSLKTKQESTTINRDEGTSTLVKHIDTTYKMVHLHARKQSKVYQEKYLGWHKYTLFMWIIFPLNMEGHKGLSI